jgi:G3E family GTPase
VAVAKLLASGGFDPADP